MDINYLTIENAFIIYDRLKSEVSIAPGKTPYLWNNVTVGENDIWLKEANNVFYLYIADVMKKDELGLFTSIKDAVDALISYYESNNLVDDIDKMRKIFYDTYGIVLEDNIVLSR